MQLLRFEKLHKIAGRKIALAVRMLQGWSGNHVGRVAKGNHVLV
jgi:hypothetical protein